MAKKHEDDWGAIIEYLNSIAARISDIEKQSRSSQNDVRQTEIYFERSGHKLEEDIANLKRGVDAAKSIVEKQKKLVKNLLKEFKGIAKHDQFMVLKEKAEEWNPERFVTRKEFNEKLKTLS